MKLKGLVDEQRYQTTLDLFTYQAGHAIVWRDAVSEWFLKMSGIPDRLGRVGHYPNRIEAESMQAVGYKPVDVVPWETASGSKAVVCTGAPVCSLTTQLYRPAGTYSIAVQYFDLTKGKSSYEFLLDGKQVATWRADGSLPSGRLDGHTSTRFTIPRIHLAPGETLTLRGTPDGAEPAPVDYIEITPVNPL
jgi:alpha-glucuronidase